MSCKKKPLKQYRVYHTDNYCAYVEATSLEEAEEIYHDGGAYDDDWIDGCIDEVVER